MYLFVFDLINSENVKSSVFVCTVLTVLLFTTVIFELN